MGEDFGLLPSEPGLDAKKAAIQIGLRPHELWLVRGNPRDSSSSIDPSWGGGQGEEFIGRLFVKRGSPTGLRGCAATLIYSLEQWTAP